MTSPTDSLTIPECSGRARRGFTLIELILVMALLAAVFAVSAPALSFFFKGRVLDGEARRFLSLTRLGQSQAAAQGVPMILWIDVAQGLYGLRADPAYFPPQFHQGDSDTNRVTFTVDEDISMAFSAPTTAMSARANTPVITGNQPGYIRFLPGGSIDQSSPHQIILQEGNEREVAVTQSAHRLYYEISETESPTPRR